MTSGCRLTPPCRAQSLLLLEAWTSYHKLPRWPTFAEDPRGGLPARPPLRRFVCYHAPFLLPKQFVTSVSASTPRAMDTTPASSATICNRLPWNWRLPSRRPAILLIAAYHALPVKNHLNTIPGLGEVTAAVLTAFILDIDRFDTPGKLVGYFGVLPIEACSGVERDGTPRGPKRYVMSRRGNDLVRRYLWMAGLCAVQHNPAVRALYARVVAKHPDKKAVAIGHAMRKLLHLAFAVWKTGKPFDPNHYPWGRQSEVKGTASSNEDSNDIPMSQNEQAAGLKSPAQPVRKEVTAACAATVAEIPPAGEGVFIDFAHLKK